MLEPLAFEMGMEEMEVLLWEEVVMVTMGGLKLDTEHPDTGMKGAQAMGKKDAQVFKELFKSTHYKIKKYKSTNKTCQVQLCCFVKEFRIKITSKISKQYFFL